jgi:hypothetical protein
MFHLACTRFNCATYAQNSMYRTINSEVVIYGSTLKIRETYNVDSPIFVVEMNNDNNKIEGIGLIRNALVYDKKHKIYENPEYNRYIYRGKYWLSRDQLLSVDHELVDAFDTVLFKGKSHLKCRLGITVITDRLFVHWNYELADLKERVKQAFIHYYKGNTRSEENEEGFIYGDMNEVPAA